MFCLGEMYFICFVFFFFFFEMYFKKDTDRYLPGRGDTMIMKVVFPGRGLSIALRMCSPLRFPQMWETRLHNLW